MPDRLKDYRTPARAGWQLSLHLIPVSDLPVQFNGQFKSNLTRYGIEHEWLRMKLYQNGSGQLLEWDHSKGDWRHDDHAWNANTNGK